MHLKKPIVRVMRISLLAGLAGLVLSGCGTPQQNLVLGAVGATLVGAHAPTNEIQQIYYLGVFDPQEQLPPAVYRVRVHGQASFISQMKFSSGWVRADLIDSLGTGIQFSEKTGGLEITKGDPKDLSALKTGRRLILFGPEGFREAPADHRLVIVMGTSPDKFFQAIDETLGIVAKAAAELRGGALDRLLFEALTVTKSEGEAIDQLAHEVERELAPPKGS